VKFVKINMLKIPLLCISRPGHWPDILSHLVHVHMLESGYKLVYYVWMDITAD